METVEIEEKEDRDNPRREGPRRDRDNPRREGGDRKKEGGDNPREKVEIEEKEALEIIQEEKVEEMMKEQIQTKRERSLEDDNQSFFWIKSEGQEKLATENMVPGNQVYKEKLIIKRGIEYRLWDPFRSKLAASIMNGLDIFPFENKSQILYLGASTGTTVSHVSDIVGPSGLFLQ